MKKTLALLFLVTSLSIKGQENTPISDTSTTKQVQTNVDTLYEISPKKTIADKIAKFLGVDKTDEIETLKKKVQVQNILIDSLSVVVTKPKIIIKTIPLLDDVQTKSIQKDEKFVNSLPKSYSNLPKHELDKITKDIDQKILELVKQRDLLLSKGDTNELVKAKTNIIQSLQREKSVIVLSQESTKLKDDNNLLEDKNDILKGETNKLKKYLYSSIIILIVLILIIAIVLQRKKINVQDIEIEKQLEDINKKNSYLEHAAKIIRHDMHSGINTYIPRGINSLEKRLTPENIEKLKIEGPIKMIKEGLDHTQKVYKSVYEFTNLVKQDVVLQKSKTNLKDLLTTYLSKTTYESQVKIDDIGELEVNETLFCTAIDNLIKNGLKYNSSENKLVKIYLDNEYLIVEDNGKGMTQKQFEKYSKPKTSESGLGISISIAILKEHGFDVDCEKSSGTKIKIKIK